MRPPFQYVSYPSGLFFKLAQGASERAGAESSDQAGGNAEALTAIMLSVAALEAFCNELAEQTNAVATDLGARLSDYASDLIARLQQAEANRKQLADKIEIIGRSNPSKQFRWGVRPFQDLKLLILLRNALTHPRGERIALGPRFRATRNPLTGQEAPLEEALANPPIHNPPTLIDYVSTRAMARWACHTACSTVHTLVSRFPPDPPDRYDFADSASAIYPRLRTRRLRLAGRPATLIAHCKQVSMAIVCVSAKWALSASTSRMIDFA